MVLETPVPYKSGALTENTSNIFLQYLNFSESQAVGSVMINNCNRREVTDRVPDLEYSLLYYFLSRLTV